MAAAEREEEEGEEERFPGNRLVAEAEEEGRHSRMVEDAARLRLGTGQHRGSESDDGGGSGSGSGMDCWYGKGGEKVGHDEEPGRD